MPSAFKVSLRLPMSTNLRSSCLFIVFLLVEWADGNDFSHLDAKIQVLERINKWVLSPKHLFKLGSIYHLKATKLLKRGHQLEAFEFKDKATESVCKIVEIWREIRAFVSRPLLLDSISRCKEMLMSQDGLTHYNQSYVENSLEILARVHPDDLELRMRLCWNLVLENSLQEAADKLKAIFMGFGPISEAKVLLALSTILLEAQDNLDEIIPRTYTAAKHIFSNLRPDLQYSLKTAEKDLVSHYFSKLLSQLEKESRLTEADLLYKIGYLIGIFRSRNKETHRQKKYLCPNVKLRPFWTKDQLGNHQGIASLEKNWKRIRNEAITVFRERKRGQFWYESYSDKTGARLEQVNIYDYGRWHQSACKKVPLTCRLLQSGFSEHLGWVDRVTFSILNPGTRVKPHSAPTNCRIRLHLGLVVPNEGYDIGLRIGDQEMKWKEGEVTLLDDAFEHEVWNFARGLNAKMSAGRNTSEQIGSSQSLPAGLRIVLIVGLWKPTVDIRQRLSIFPTGAEITGGNVFYEDQGHVVQGVDVEENWMYWRYRLD